MDSPEAAAMSAVLEFLQKRYGPRCVLGVRIDLKQTRVRLRIDLDPKPFAPSPEDAQDGMTETERAIFSTLAEAEKPLKGEAVARRAGKKFNSHFSKVLADMKRSGELVSIDGGYWLAERDAPTQSEAQEETQS